MNVEIIKSFIQKFSAAIISLTLMSSLIFPLSVRAEDMQTEVVTPPQPTAKTEPVQPTTTDPQPNTVITNPPEIDSLAPQTSTTVTSDSPTTHTEAQTDASVSNAIASDATSGNASASQNTTVDDITSGNASAIATVVNLLQSNVNLNGSQPIVFIQDVTGNVNGDLLIDPATLASLDTTSPVFGEGSSVSAEASMHAAIANALNINATSGSASALQNTTVGNVQSGSAHAVANVVNIINSAINANQSFVGMINIYGNLTGNILVPAEFVNSVLGTGSSVDPTSVPIITTDVNATVTNNVTTSAQSGSASATNNSNTGAVGTGQANTNVTILNLTSSQTVGKNALLVFVNVLGNWVGLILDAPAGTTSASLGDNTSNSNSNTTQASSIENTSNLHINNAITTNATSGNTDASQNTTVGDVQSGDASASVNLLNILNSQISLSDWFGILFINVFGEWAGNFGVQTAAVDPPVNPGSGNGGSTNNGSSSSPPTISFISANERDYTVQPLTYTTDVANQGNVTPPTGLGQSSSVMGATTLTNSDTRNDAISLQSGKDKIEGQGLRWWLLPLILLLAALLIITRYYSTRNRDGEIEEKEI